MLLYFGSRDIVSHLGVFVCECDHTVERWDTPATSGTLGGMRLRRIWRDLRQHDPNRDPHGVSYRSPNNT